MTVLILGVMIAFGFTLLIFSLSLEREKGALSQRIKQLEEKAEISRKQAEIMAQARTDNETIDRLDNGSF